MILGAVGLPARYRRPAGMTAGSAARRGAIDHKVPLLTDIKCAKLFVKSLNDIWIEPIVGVSRLAIGVDVILYPCASCRAFFLAV